MVARTLTQIDPRKLSNHPLNIRIYGEGIDQDLVADIKARGVVTPLLVTPKHVVIDGHRRRRHAIVAGVESVPIVTAKDLTDPLDIEEAIILSNRTMKERTTEQKAREYERLKEIEAERAQKRMVQGGKKKGTEIFTDPGESAEKAAKEVGLSRPTAEKAAEVVGAIDQATAVGDLATAEVLRKTLNTKNVNAAHRQAKPPKKTSGKPAGFNFRQVEELIGKAVRMIDDYVRKEGITRSIHHRACIDGANAVLKGWKSLTKESAKK